MRVLVATDAAPPQVNGVVRTYQRLADELARKSVELVCVTPSDYRSLPLPFYRDIRLALPGFKRTAELVARHAPDFVHIATEGPVGWMVRRLCLIEKRPFTTSYHTKFPEYAAAFLGLPPRLFYAAARRFHGAGEGMMVATPSLAADLAVRGFARILPWSRGVDARLFHPRSVRLFGDGAPVFLYVGRISREKNIEAFLAADLPGRKVVVGEGPHRPVLEARFPDAVFPGPRYGEGLAEVYASADVFVFPSRTDTFGLVLLEAMASGLPVAAYPVTGPIDVVLNGETGVLHDDLALAARSALQLDREAARRHAQSFGWSRVADQFIENLQTAHAAARNGRIGQYDGERQGLAHHGPSARRKPVGEPIKRFEGEPVV